MNLSILRPAAALAFAAVVLGGCSSDKETLCPGAAALVSAAQMTQFRKDAPQDPSGVLYNVSITNVDTDCDLDLANNKKTDVGADSDVRIQFRATRTPNGTAATYTIPYFVAVTTGGKILDKKNYTVTFGFQPGDAVSNFDTDIDSVEIKVGKEMHAYNYQILVGLQLTKEQLEYNKKVERYGP